ncbi:MAG: hypothetical protein ACSW8J_05030, partial [bacterium]
MENKVPENNTPEKKRPGRLAHGLAWLGHSLRDALLRNLWLKLLSLLLAILLWNYVISTNTSITRAKVISGLTGYVTGQTTLNANRLALLTDPSDQLSNISVTVDVPQAYFPRVNTENV